MTTTKMTKGKVTQNSGRTPAIGSNWTMILIDGVPHLFSDVTAKGVHVRAGIDATDDTFWAIAEYPQDTEAEPVSVSGYDNMREALTCLAIEVDCYVEGEDEDGDCIDIYPWCPPDGWDSRFDQP